MKSLYQRLEAICTEIEKILAARKSQPTLYVRRDPYEGSRWHLCESQTGSRVLTITRRDVTRSEIMLDFERLGYQNITAE